MRTIAVVAVAVLAVAGMVAPVAAAPTPAPTPDGDDGTVSEQATTRQKVTISGRILKPDGQFASDNLIFVREYEDGLFGPGDYLGGHSTLTNDTGGFSLEVPKDRYYVVSYYQIHQNLSRDGLVPVAGGEEFPADGIPDVYAVSEVYVNQDTALDPVQLPTAHNVSVDVLYDPKPNTYGSEREPVDDGTVDFEDQNDGVAAGIYNIPIGSNGTIQTPAGDSYEVAGGLYVNATPEPRKEYTRQLLGSDGSYTIDRDGFVELEFDANIPPTAIVSVSNETPAARETVGFNSLKSEDSDGSVERTEWNFDGDGTVDATGSYASHEYATAGNYTANMTVYDDRGLASSVETTIQVQENESSVFQSGLGGSTSPPMDPDGDGLYEDVNGDGATGFTDVLALSFALSEDYSTAQVEALDFEDDGRLTFADAIALAFAL